MITVLNCMKKIIGVLLIGILLHSPNAVAGNPPGPGGKEPRGTENIAFQWGKIALDATANDTERFRPRPTVTSRMLGLVWTAIFDAWSRLDDKARPVYLQRVNRLPAVARTLKNKEKAVSYAAYRALLEYFFSDSILFRNKMIELG